METLTREPTRISSIGATTAALVALVLAGAASIEGGIIAVVGAALIGLGLFWDSGRAIDFGAGILFFGVIVGGLVEAPVILTVLGALAVVVAWDLGTSALEFGRQLGRETPTARLEGVHIVASLLVGVATATVGYGAYLFGTGGQPAGAIILLLLAVIFLIVGLRR